MFLLKAKRESLHLGLVVHSSVVQSSQSNYPREHNGSHQCRVSDLVSILKALSEVDKPLCVCVMSITITFPLYQVLVLLFFSIHLSSINFSALASCGCLVEWCTILAVETKRTVHLTSNLTQLPREMLRLIN